MTTWNNFRDEAPELAAAVRARFEETKHHVLATLRVDGAPRVSGTEVGFHGPDLALGSMPDARKAHDLQRDGRFALHANPGDPDQMVTGDANPGVPEQKVTGDAKLSGTAVEVTDPEELETYRTPGTPPGPFHLFRLSLTDVVLTSVEGDRLVIRRWRPGEGVLEWRRA